MVCHARLLEWGQLTRSTVSVHHSLRLLSSMAKGLWLLILFPHLMLLVCVCTQQIFTLVVPAWDVVGSETPGMCFLVASSSILQYTVYASSMLSAVVTGRVTAVTSTSLSNSGQLALRKFDYLFLHNYSDDLFSVLHQPHFHTFADKNSPYLFCLQKNK